jgi:hypothetical protein
MSTVHGRSDPRRTSSHTKMQLSRSDAESKLIKDHSNREAPSSCMSMAYRLSSMIQVSLNTCSIQVSSTMQASPTNQVSPTIHGASTMHVASTIHFFSSAAIKWHLRQTQSYAEVRVVSDNHLNSDSEGPEKTLGLDERLGNYSDRQRQFSTSGSILGTVAPPCEYSGTHGHSSCLIRRNRGSIIEGGGIETTWNINLSKFYPNMILACHLVKPKTTGLSLVRIISKHIDSFGPLLLDRRLPELGTTLRLIQL